MTSHEENLERLGALVLRDRRRQYGSVEAAIRQAGISRATWLRVEDGMTVRDESLSRIEEALGWPAGQAWRVLAGESEESAQPAAERDPIRQAILDSATLSARDKEILMAQLEVMERTNETARDDGADEDGSESSKRFA